MRMPLLEWSGKGRVRLIAYLAPFSLLIGSSSLFAAPPQATPLNAPRWDTASARTIRFNRDIRPILSENCFKCHGPDKNTRMADLRLDIEEGARADRGGYAAIVPGKPERSALIARITAKDAAVRMPPLYTGKTLSPQEIERLRLWIAQGAKWEGHWAYQPITRPEPPPTTDKTWPLGAIDRFLLARLEKEGLRPSPGADRRTLIRRLSLDLTGLPPTPEEVRAFLADRRPGAYERLVERLLTSPHYGERMAQYWLDLVRYADTVGYHGDQEVSIWPYRDYVIASFNSNKPFDRFTREQLAGDLLPDAGREEKVASGYNRLGMMSTEGGVQDKEYRAKYATDRVKNVSSVWLGATMGCAECHDHKFDPYKQKDFYRLAAFFADLKEKGYYGGGFPRGDWGPKLRLSTPEQEAQLARLDADIAAAKKELDAVTDDALAAARAEWEKAILALDSAKTPAWTVAVPTAATSSDGSTMTVEEGGVVFVSGALPVFDTYTVTLPANLPRIAAIRLEALGDARLPGDGIARSGQYAVLSEFTVAVQEGNGPLRPIAIKEVEVNSEDEGFPGLAAIDGRPDTGWTPGIHGGYAPQAVFRLAEPVTGGPNTKLVVTLQQATKPRLAIGKFRLSLTGLDGVDRSAQGAPDAVLAVLRKEPAKRTPEDIKRIAEHYRRIAPALEEPRQRLARLNAERLLLLGQIPTTLITETVEPRVIRVLPRGNWMDDSGEVVTPGVPAFLPQIKRTDRATRNDLVNWILSPQNPLTARVFVNRLWKLFFGIGLTKSLDDFGVQGEQPVHPELLDWLASEFIRSGWDVKHMVRLMVTSRAYRQTSKATPTLLARDPFNRLYARQSMVRLDAEFVRDVALAASGLLVNRVGGPSVRPYQPKGYLAALNFPRREWSSDIGENLYRRSLYVHWQRTFLHPSLAAFDAPTREECTVNRVVSNTPMQALVLLNDPIFVEAARVFAERMLRESETTPEQRIAYAYEHALSRLPRQEEIAVLKRLYERERARYRADREAAQRLIATGEWPVPTDLDSAELAAWTAVARAILNLHETITRS